jgi:hypothetical protein
VLGEITAAEGRQEELKKQAKDAYDQHVDGLNRAGWELDRTILAKSYEAGAKLKVFKEQAGHGNFKKGVKSAFGISHRTAVDYMELAEWWDRIEEYAKQVGGVSLLQVQTLRGVRRLLTEVRETEEFVKKAEEAAAKGVKLTALVETVAPSGPGPVRKAPVRKAPDDGSAPKTWAEKQRFHMRGSLEEIIMGDGEGGYAEGQCLGLQDVVGVLCQTWALDRLREFRDLLDGEIERKATGAGANDNGVAAASEHATVQ